MLVNMPTFQGPITLNSDHVASIQGITLMVTGRYREHEIRMSNGDVHRTGLQKDEIERRLQGKSF